MKIPISNKTFDALIDLITPDVSKMSDKEVDDYLREQGIDTSESWKVIQAALERRRKAGASDICIIDDPVKDL